MISDEIQLTDTEDDEEDDEPAGTSSFCRQMSTSTQEACQNGGNYNVSGFLYGAFSPDANEALKASDLHVKSMQRRDRHPEA